VKQIQLEVQS